MTPDEIKAKLVTAVKSYTTSPTMREDILAVLKDSYTTEPIEMTILRALSLGYTQGYAKGSGLIQPQSQGADNGTPPVYL